MGRCWVRVNAPYTEDCERDLEAVGGRACGIRIPKVESQADVAWVRERAPGKPLICAVETARGVLAAVDVAQAEGVVRLALGGVDLRHDIRSDGGDLSTIYARSHLVMASRAADLDPPVDSVFGQLDDQAGLEGEAQFAKSLGFFGKSAIHPSQLPIIHSVFTPTAEDLRVWGRAGARGVRGVGRCRHEAGHRRVRRPTEWLTGRTTCSGEAGKPQMHVGRAAVGSETHWPRMNARPRSVGSGL